MLISQMRNLKLRGLTHLLRLLSGKVGDGSATCVMETGLRMPRGYILCPQGAARRAQSLALGHSFPEQRVPGRSLSSTIPSEDTSFFYADKRLMEKYALVQIMKEVVL